MSLTHIYDHRLLNALVLAFICKCLSVIFISYWIGPVKKDIAIRGSNAYIQLKGGGQRDAERTIVVVVSTLCRSFVRWLLIRNWRR